MATTTAYPPLIALAGRAGSGKSTIAKAVLELAPAARLDSFAAPLKAIACSLPGLHLGMASSIRGGGWVAAKEDWPATSRAFMQALGDGIQEHFGRQLCADALLVRAKRHGVPVIVDDLRYQHELQAVHRAGGLVLRLEGLASTLPSGLDEHSSEADVDLLEGLDDTILFRHQDPAAPVAAYILGLVGELRPDWSLRS